MPPARVYPRVCGGTVHDDHTAEIANGLSPRVRGNRRGPTPAPGRRGSIPACAGEPSPDHSRSIHTTVYPRVCGGTSSFGEGDEQVGGLSPRVRGNQHCCTSSIGIEGSIPACAGEPSSPSYANKGVRVYPRVCGGTLHDAPSNVVPQGLSPRVRGNPGRIVLIIPS